MMLPAASGFLAGLIHVLSGPDHLAAIAPLAVEGRRRTWITGLTWGIGHTTGVWLVGALAFLLRGLLPLESLSSWSERVVGFVLIGIGLWGFRKVFLLRLHAHAHAHDGQSHTHVHLHSETHQAQPKAHLHPHAAAGIGVLHGLAGSSHFLGILPALALPSNGAAIAYLLAFGIGSIAAMAGFSWLIGYVAGRFGAGVGSYRWFLGACSAAAVGIGCLWIAI